MSGGVDFEVDHGRVDGAEELRLSGILALSGSAPALARLRGLLGSDPLPVRLDLSGLVQLDGASAALLVRLRDELRGAGRPAELVGARAGVAEILQLYTRTGREPARPPPERVGILEQLGRASLEQVAELREILAMLGDLFVAGLASIRAPGSLRWRDVTRLMERTGADALPIVGLITFLIGLVTGFQASIQLRQFGADIFIADAVALSITRELGPLMTAIIVAGRSGAAFAAEIGTMRVSEEIDALHTLGLDEYRFLVFPRLLALVCMMPLLTLIADVVGVLGGLCVGLSAGIPPVAYLIETRAAIGLWDAGSGLIKSVFFALAIGVIACQRGLATRGGAEGVGRSTTSSVVTILFALIAIDAAFTVVFHVLGL